MQFPTMYKILRIIRPIEKSCFGSYTRLAYSTTDTVKTDDSNVSEDKSNHVGGFAKSFDKHTDIIEHKDPEEKLSFASLLRNSKFIDLGDPVNKVVIGKVYHTVADDLYIDFGWKFHCVCTRPTTRSEEYVRGARVRIQIKDLELSSRFLGSTTDLTLLEADCKLLGLVSSPTRPAASNK